MKRLFRRGTDQIVSIGDKIGNKRVIDLIPPQNAEFGEGRVYARDEKRKIHRCDPAELGVEFREVYTDGARRT